jgi:hypothetical protein
VSMMHRPKTLVPSRKRNLPSGDGPTLHQHVIRPQRLNGSRVFDVGRTRQTLALAPFEGLTSHGWIGGNVMTWLSEASHSLRRLKQSGQ